MPVDTLSDLTRYASPPPAWKKTKENKGLKIGEKTQNFEPQKSFKMDD